MGRLASNREYAEWLTDLKLKIRRNQVKAAVQVNETLLRLYWEMGREINERQKESQWGSGFLAQLSKDLMAEFPDMKGFSRSNLQHIRSFYAFYVGVKPICEQAAHKLVPDVSNGICEQAARKLEIVANDDTTSNIICSIPEEIFRIPWWHHIILMRKCKTPQEALFYVHKTIEGNWSRSVLLNMLDTGLYEANGQAITNFSSTLPVPQGELARETLKDPYVFDFLTMRESYNERELENALTDNITRFLLELGTGFAYVGKQVRIQVGEEEFFLDLLFYHLKLRCFVVVELKTVKFEPSQLGQLGFYVTAVNEQLRHPSDNETIGLLICKTKDKVVAEYALKNAAQPLGISEYQLSRLLPDEIKSSLPTIEEIEAELEEKQDNIEKR
jgi:predicted nuclease of restriction endonuclease-like (RecB) superfamily